MKLRNLALYGMVVLPLLVLTVGVGAKEARSQQPIKIGALVDLTGPIGPGGVDAKKGIDLAMELLGAPIAGRPVQLILEDAGSDAGVTMDKARKLVETDKVVLIIGPVNGGGVVAMSKYAARVRVPDLPIVNAPDEAANSKWSFIVSALEVQQGFPVGVYAYDVLGYRTTVGLGADFVAGHDYIEAFNLGFQERGGKVIDVTYFPEGSNNYVPYFTSLKKADCLNFWGTPGDMFAAFPQYKELNMKMPILQAEDGGVTASPGMLHLLGDSAIGVVFGTAYLYNADTPGNKEFVAAYQKKYNELPSVMSGCGYANVQEALAALRATGGDTSPDAIWKAMKNLSVDTVRGHVAFPPENNIVIYDSMIGTITPDMKIKHLATYKVKVQKKNGKFMPVLVQ